MLLDLLLGGEKGPSKWMHNSLNYCHILPKGFLNNASQEPGLSWTPQINLNMTKLYHSPNRVWFTFFLYWDFGPLFPAFRVLPNHLLSSEMLYLIFSPKCVINPLILQFLSSRSTHSRRTFFLALYLPSCSSLPSLPHTSRNVHPLAIHLPSSKVQEACLCHRLTNLVLKDLSLT